MNVVVIGMGYVGIPCAAVFATVEGIKVIGVQRRSKRSGWKIDHINKGMCPISGDEPGLEELIRTTVQNKTFRVTDDVSVCKDADAILVDVQTPVDEHRVPVYEPLKSACESVGEHLNQGTLVVIESTVPPGTTEHLVRPMLEKKSGLAAGDEFHLAFSFERVKPGRLLHNLVHLPRIVGGLNDISGRKAAELYSHIVKANIVVTDCLTAEVTKCVENAYRDVNIAFANEVALLCERLGVDAYEVRGLANTLSHVDVHAPGAGVGGHCLPKDTWLLLHGVESYGEPGLLKPQVLTAARNVNDYMPRHVARLVETALLTDGRSLRSSKITIMGIAYLENTDDPRNTPALPLIRILQKKGAQLIAHDPHVKEFEGIALTSDLHKAVAGSDALVFVTRHKDYLTLSPQDLKSSMRGSVIVDARDIFDPSVFTAKGFTFLAVGKGKRRPTLG